MFSGISAQDRAKTIRIAINPKVKKSEIVSPGHVFPLVARNGGVLERAGHTEASIDISKMSKLNPSSVICEVMNEDGRMARLDDLVKFSKKHKIKIASIEDIINWSPDVIYKTPRDQRKLIGEERSRSISQIVELSVLSEREEVIIDKPLIWLASNFGWYPFGLLGVFSTSW